jgi:Domain of unknown function (DUF4160)
VGKVHQIGKIIIRIYADDHPPPHFHVKSPSFEAIIDIETLAVSRGAISVQARGAVMQWIKANRAAIVKEWNRINPRFPVR